MMDQYKNIYPLMKLKSELTDVRAFHENINKSFHDVESKYYDQLHKEMWKSLPEQFNLIVGDLLKTGVCLKDSMHILDIGCGTGLSSELLLQTAIRDNITKITMLDTSVGMLKKAMNRSAKWGKEIIIIEGEITNCIQRFDLILISSVLHHIPDLETFFRMVSKFLNPGGILLTLHDPLHEAVNSSVYIQRCSEYRNSLKELNINPITSLLKKLMRRISTSSKYNYIEETNAVLLKNQIIHTALTEVEMWSITDIHVENLPYSNKQGISINAIIDKLTDFTLVNYRTYAFFGTLQTNLDITFSKKERELILKNDKYGRNFSSIWLKNGN